MSSSVEERASRRVVAVTMDGNQVRRTTKLRLSHFWQTRFTRSDRTECSCMSGFASSEEKARKAAAGETARVLKFLRSNGVITGEVRTHIVPVSEES